ncbi:hypothetical protein [Enterococcus sp. AZ163]|uniref:hypothetical protein n=1 Tax=Enterococcus sp. AZ163 TaxID=2774638 RepID=UPI003D2D4690
MIVTKCSFAKPETEQQIHLLGHEAYATTSVLLDLPKKRAVVDVFFAYFHLILLSEMISEYEKPELLVQLLEQNLKIVQKVAHQPLRKNTNIQKMTNRDTSQEEIDRIANGLRLFVCHAAGIW